MTRGLLTLVVSLTLAPAIAAASAVLDSGHEILAVSDNRIVTLDKKERKQVAVFTRERKLTSTFALRAAPIAYHLSLDERLFAVAEGDKVGTRVFDVQSGQALFEVEALPALRSLFWVGACQLAALSSAPKGKDVEHTVKIYPVPESVVKARELPCPAVNGEDRVPAAFFTDHGNVWGALRDGTKSDLGWIGRGEISAMRPGKGVFFYYIQGPSLFRARVDTRKVQPISGDVVDAYPARKRDLVLVQKSGGRVDRLDLKEGTTYAEKTLRAKGVRRIWMGEAGEWALLQLESGVFEVEALR